MRLGEFGPGVGAGEQVACLLADTRDGGASQLLDEGVGLVSGVVVQFAGDHEIHANPRPGARDCDLVRLEVHARLSEL